MKIYIRFLLIFVFPLFAAGTLRGDLILVDYNDNVTGGGHDLEVLKGGFSGLTNSAFAPWVSLNTGTPQFANTFASPGSGSENYIATGDRTLGLDTGYSIASGDSFNVAFSWRDAANWDADDTIFLRLFYTDNDLIDGTATTIGTLDSEGRVSTATWEFESGSFLSDGGAVGRTLFVSIGANSTTGEFARVDDIFVQSVSAVPEPSSALMVICGLGLTCLRRRR